jgi:SAM-dependent methyltransferase
MEARTILPEASPKTVCPCCSSTTISTWTAVPTIDPNCAGLVPLAVCRSCDHWFHSSVPDDETLRRLYGEGSELVVPRGYKGTSQDEPSALVAMVSRLRAVAPDLAAARYLEVGAGNGALLRYVAGCGARAIGVDPGSWANASPGMVPSLERVPADLKPTLVVMLDVLEHVSDPLALLQQARLLAHQSARIVVTVPNCESLAARTRRGRWRMVRPYGHLHYFSRRSLEALLRRAGWVDSEAEPMRIAGATMLGELTSVLRSLRQGKLRLAASGLAYSTLLGGRDQWIVTARASRSC